LIEAIATKTDMNAHARKWQRFKIDVRVKIRRSKDPDNAVVVRSDLLSEGGLSVYTPESLEIGASVLVEFSLPGTPKLQLRALIRNRCGFRCGMEFMDVAPSDRTLIRRYLQSLVSEPSEVKNAEADHAAKANQLQRRQNGQPLQSC
jgi:hypothetical protein